MNMHDVCGGYIDLDGNCYKCLFKKVFAQDIRRSIYFVELLHTTEVITQILSHYCKECEKKISDLSGSELIKAEKLISKMQLKENRKKIKEILKHFQKEQVSI